MEDFETKIKLSGTVTDITYRNDVNGYTVFTLDKGDEELTVVGTTVDVKLGDKIEVIGDYTYHSLYGRQFKAEMVTATLPETVDDLYHYLASGVIKGIRESTARKIIEHFGSKAFDVLSDEPERLAEIKGISLEKAKKIGHEYNKQCSTRALIISLSKYGLKTNECLVAYEKLGSGALDIIEENPYVLCEGENRISFERVEQIAEMLPTKPNAQYRIEAGIIYVISHNLNNGHTCLPLEKIFLPSSELLEESRDNLEIAIDNLVARKRLVIENIDGKDFVFIPEAYNAEKSIANRISILLRYPPENPIDVKSQIQKIEKKHNIE